MTLATVFDDAPYTYENGDEVTNYNPDEYRGLITIRDAIIDSNNIVAVKALTQLTPQVGYDFLLKLGFTTLVNNRQTASGGTETDVNQALSLGGITDGVTNVELTAAYAAIANHGYYNTPILYTSVEDSHGNVLLQHESSPKTGDEGNHRLAADRCHEGCGLRGKRRGGPAFLRHGCCRQDGNHFQ